MLAGKQFKIIKEASSYSISNTRYKLKKDNKIESYKAIDESGNFILINDGNRWTWNIRIYDIEENDLTFLAANNGALVDFIPNIGAEFFKYKVWLDYVYDSHTNKVQDYIDLTLTRFYLEKHEFSFPGFEVESIYPENGRTDVPENQPIYITFTEDVSSWFFSENGMPVLKEYISVYKSTAPTERHPFEFSIDTGFEGYKTIKLVPTTNYDTVFSTYNIVIKKINSKYGEELQNIVMGSFETEAGPVADIRFSFFSDISFSIQSPWTGNGGDEPGGGDDPNPGTNLNIRDTIRIYFGISVANLKENVYFRSNLASGILQEGILVDTTLANNSTVSNISILTEFGFTSADSVEDEGLDNLQDEEDIIIAFGDIVIDGNSPTINVPEPFDTEMTISM